VSFISPAVDRLSINNCPHCVHVTESVNIVLNTCVRLKILCLSSGSTFGRPTGVTVIMSADVLYRPS
jgi:hypothetical protein